MPDCDKSHKASIKLVLSGNSLEVRKWFSNNYNLTNFFSKKIVKSAYGENPIELLNLTLRIGSQSLIIENRCL